MERSGDNSSWSRAGSYTTTRVTVSHTMSNRNDSYSLVSSHDSFTLNSHGREAYVPDATNNDVPTRNPTDTSYNGMESPISYITYRNIPRHMTNRRRYYRDRFCISSWNPDLTPYACYAVDQITLYGRGYRRINDSLNALDTIHRRNWLIDPTGDDPTVIRIVMDNLDNKRTNQYRSWNVTDANLVTMWDMLTINTS